MTKLQPTDKGAALVALWGTLSPAQQVAFRRIVEAAPADSVPEDQTASCADTGDAVGMGIVVDEPKSTVDRAPTDLMTPAEAEIAEPVEVSFSAASPAAEILPAAETTAGEVMEDPLEVEFASLSPEQWDIDRD